MPTISNLTPSPATPSPRTPPRRRQSAQEAARSPTRPKPGGRLRTPAAALTIAPETTEEALGEETPAPPDPETRARPRRRTFTTKYKRKIVLEASAMSPAERGAFLRREGLYSSHYTEWRAQLSAGMLGAVAKRGPKGKDPLLVENERLQRRLAQMELKLRQAEVIMSAQKKFAELLGISLEPPSVDSSEDE